VSGLLAVGLVDPRGGGKWGWFWRSGDEAFGPDRVGGGEDAGAVGAQLLGLAVVDGGGGHEPEGGVAVVVVVVVEELAARRPPMLCS
jgi:hypothetical protein